MFDYKMHIIWVMMSYSSKCSCDLCTWLHEYEFFVLYV